MSHTRSFRQRLRGLSAQEFVQMRSLSAFAQARRGGVANFAGLLFVAVSALVGGAAEVSQLYRLQAAAQKAADAATIIGLRDPSLDQAALAQIVETRLASSGVDPETVAISAARDGARLDVTVSGTSATWLLQSVNLPSLSYNVTAAGERGGGYGSIEVVLALDVTGSMSPHMDGMKEAAHDLINILAAHADSGADVRAALAPYAGAVNIGTGALQESWLLKDSVGRWQDAPTMNGYTIARLENPGCHAPPPVPDPSDPPLDSDPPGCYTCGCEGYPACDPGGGGGEGGGSDAFLRSPPQPALKPFGLANLAALMGEALVSSAHASTASLQTAYPFPRPDQDAAADCWLHTPTNINKWELFQGMADESWEGCVSTRPIPHDLTDALPDPATPDTMFSAYLWPDAPDDNETAHFTNDYLPDFNNDQPDLSVLDPASSPTRYTSTWSRRANVWKYGYDGFDSTSGPDGANRRTGPNRGCPEPIAPLTSDLTGISLQIDALSAERGGGTLTSEGVMWGWRVLSPSAPFTEGAAYSEDTLKVIVLMGDGAPDVVRRPNNVDGMYGDYTAYGYPNHFGYSGLTFDNTLTRAENYQAWLAQKTLDACSAAKNAYPDNPIQIYAVLFNDGDADAAQTLMQDCATVVLTHYHEASDLQTLGDAFTEIGDAITGAAEIRLIK